MPDDLYILAATAVKRNEPTLGRRIVIEYTLERSKEEAYKKAGPLIFEKHFPATVWRDPMLRVEMVPTHRIERYRNELKIRDDSLTQLTFLWGYVIFVHQSFSLQCATIIAQTKGIAEESVMSGSGKYTRERKDIFVEKIPSRLILPRPPGYEDPAEIFRNRFSDIMKK